MLSSSDKVEFDRNLKCLWDEYLDVGARAFKWDQLSEIDRVTVGNDCNRLLEAAYKLRADLWLLKDKGVISEDKDLSENNLGCVLSLVGQVFIDMDMFESACGVLRQAYQLCTDNAHIIESLVRALLRARRYSDAATVFNQLDPRIIASEDDSTAIKMVQFATTNYHFTHSLDAGRLKYCVELIAKHGSEGSTSD